MRPEQVESIDDEYKKENLKQQIRCINDRLKMYGFNQLGDLYKINNSEVEKTIRAVNDLMNQKKTDQETRCALNERISKLEN